MTIGACLWLFVTTSLAQNVEYRDGVIAIEGSNVPWLLKTDGSQYLWVTDKYQWGKTCFTANGLTNSEERIVKSEKFATALERYAKFVRERLQYPDYRTKSNARHGGKNRGYNYAWVADFYFRMSLSTASLATASTASTTPLPQDSRHWSRPVWISSASSCCRTSAPRQTFW